MKKLIYLTFAIFIVVAIVQYSRIDKRNRYKSTHDCANKNQFHLVIQFPLGASRSDLLTDIEKIKYSHFGNKSIYSSRFVDVMPEPCPESGRPYCGHSLEFRNDTLVDITENYPCH